MKEPIVTKDSLKALIERDPALVIGRALVALFHRQTTEEREHSKTRFRNGVGFTGTDGRIGAITAKYYLKHHTLLDWQVANWMKPNRKDEPRILKYAAQLNDIAVEKRQDRLRREGLSIIRDALKQVRNESV